MSKLFFFFCNPFPLLWHNHCGSRYLVHSLLILAKEIHNTGDLLEIFSANNYNVTGIKSHSIIHFCIYFLGWKKYNFRNLGLIKYTTYVSFQVEKNYKDAHLVLKKKTQINIKNQEQRNQVSNTNFQVGGRGRGITYWFATSHHL